VVLGNPEYYHLFGFGRASNFGLQNEYGVDEEFMVIRFKEHEFSKERLADKLVRYAPEFALFSL
jgi:predicted N-acetyltransferase YhbS